MSEVKKMIESGKTSLGIELGSTRVKAVLIGENHTPIAQGNYEWENTLLNGIWTYSTEEVWAALKGAYAELKEDVMKQYGVKLTKVGSMGFSAMMHGYMPFDASGKLLVPFRTWRNTITGEASEELTKWFNFHIPQRWSIAHLYQAMLNKEEHVKDITFFTTLAGYVHWMLTGEKVLGVGEASGMFPIDSATCDYDKTMVETFEKKTASFGFNWKLSEILPKVLNAGDAAGSLTKEGALLLDPTGDLEAGIPVCPPEGDAGTGMVATNAISERTGNVSAGTSVFAMVVMEKPLSKAYEELDLVTTPNGRAVAMVHCNNCTSDLNAWVNLFAETLETFGMKVDKNDVYGTLYRKALEADTDCGNLMSYNYFSGEHITGLNEGRPMFVRMPDSKFTLANFMRTNLFSALGALKVGLDILLKEEHVKVDRITGHGGLFKTKGVGQPFLAAAIDAPVSVMETAGEGGAWGMAVLAAYALEKNGRSLDDYLNEEIFKDAVAETVQPDSKYVESFDAFEARYKAGIPAEKAAVECFQ